MRTVEPILIAHLFAPINDQLVALLRDLAPEEWSAPTVAGAWTVKDVAAHLLDTTLRRLSMHRDGYTPPLPPDAFANGIGGFVNAMNANGVTWARRLSPSLLIDLHERYGAEMARFFESLDPFTTAKWGVTWAGEEQSANWFDIARELTERWHHQQQIRDATHRAPLFQHLGPVIDTFVRALPFTYRDVDAPARTAVLLRVTDEGEGSWSLVREDGRWVLYAGEAESPAATMTMRGDTAWRLFTRQKVEGWVVDGDRQLAAPLLNMTSVI
jgi:uncharacterized protein (TIGR03083 family)